MGLFRIFKKTISDKKSVASNDLTPEEKTLLRRISRLNACGGNISPELYQQLRNFEVDWLERNYDFHSIAGINSIPDKNPQRPPTEGVTGAVYYYLRRKGYEHEEDGNIDLAIACMRKSVALLKHTGYFSVDEAYPLVKVLARAGYIDEAYKEKSKIDAYVNWNHTNLDQSAIRQVMNSAAYFKTDFVIMSVIGCACPECAKYQGRVYSLSGKSKKFPKTPSFFSALRSAPCDCGHSFSPYIDGIDDPQLAYTLSVHPLQNKAYGKDIVTFSNRPFVDDRTEEYKQAMIKDLQEHSLMQAHRQRYRDEMIEIEARRGQERRDYAWLQANLPDKCPKSISGFRRMKTQNTKNYQALQQAAAELGRNI